CPTHAASVRRRGGGRGAPSAPRPVRARRAAPVAPSPPRHRPWHSTPDTALQLVCHDELLPGRQRPPPALAETEARGAIVLRSRRRRNPARGGVTASARPHPSFPRATRLPCPLPTCAKAAA